MIFMEIYKGYEIFKDTNYNQMFCIRKKGSRDFDEAIHVASIQDTKQTIDEITILSDYMDWYKNTYGGVIMVSEYLIAKFVCFR